MSPKQYWNLARFSCGRCGVKIEVSTEADFINLYAGHQVNCGVSRQNPLVQAPDTVTFERTAADRAPKARRSSISHEEMGDW